jgi:hypothetical protein
MKLPEIEMMKTTQGSLRGERGVILITVLLLLSLLIAGGMGAALSVQNDFRMTANLRSGTAASYLADAGIEWSKQRIAVVTTMPPVLSDGTHGLASGAYTVKFLSSTQTGPLSANVVLRSVGKAQSASQMVQARITKTYDLTDGAVALRGNSRGVNFAGSFFSISGLDHDLTTGAPIPGSRSRAGISVGTIAVLNQLTGALNQEQEQNIAGDDGNGAVIAASDYISADDVARIASDLCAAPQAVAANVLASGNLSIVDQTWGGTSGLQLRCVNGLPGSGDSVVFGGNSGGAGVLAVRDAQLVLTGNFRWQGLIIVSGGDVGFRALDAANKEIVGALVIHESGNGTGSGPPLLDIQGTLRVQYSRQALNLAAALVPPATLASSYASLPALLKQDYRRAITP